MMGAVFIDGRFAPPGERVISVYDRGFLYGDSVFEAVRVYSGVPFRLADHMARLEQSASAVGMQLPVAASALAEEVQRAVAVAGADDAYLRIVVTRGEGARGLAIPPDATPRRVILVEALSLPPPEAYADGVAALCVPSARAVDGTTAAYAKYGHYLGNLLALREARERGAAEALFLDSQGRILEGATSNVFFVFGTELVGPPLNAGILPGITRATVIDLAPSLGLTVRDALLAPSALTEADEVFITSSIRELVPVVRVDDRVVRSGRPGPRTRALHRAFRNRVRAGFGAGRMPWDQADQADQAGERSDGDEHANDPDGAPATRQGSP